VLPASAVQWDLAVLRPQATQVPMVQAVKVGMEMVE
jgi:hypothetical protein